MPDRHLAGEFSLGRIGDRDMIKMGMGMPLGSGNMLLAAAFPVGISSLISR